MLVRPSTRSWAAGSLILLVFLALAGTLGATARHDLNASRALVRLTYEGMVMVTVEQITADLADAESRQRDFQLTADPAYLDAFGAAIRRMEHGLDGLATVPFVDRAAAGHLVRLRSLVAQKSAELQRSIDDERTGDVAGALLVLRDQGGDIGSRILDETTRLLAAERRALDERVDAANRVDRVATWQLALAGMLAIAAFGGGLLMMMHHHHRGGARKPTHGPSSVRRAAERAEAINAPSMAQSINAYRMSMNERPPLGPA